MFDLSSIPFNATIVRANLELYVYSGTYCMLGGCYVNAHYSSDNSWTETGITYNNGPSYNATPTYRMSPGMWTGWETWGITSDVQKVLGLPDKRLTEVLVRAGASGSYYSRESGSRRPDLMVEYLAPPYYTVRLESHQDTGATSNLGFITIDGAVPPLPAEVTAKPGTYDISYDGGYQFTKWEASGGVSVANPSAQTTTVTVSGAGTLRAVGSVETFGYYYDDGSDDSGDFEKAGAMWAVRFTPLFSGRLVTARFYIHDDPTTFKIRVMDGDRIDLITPFTQTAPSVGWFNVDLSGYNVWVRRGRDFYIGMEWVTDYKPEIGVDWTDPGNQRSWRWNGTVWDSSPNYSWDYMIRAVVKTMATPSQVSLLLSSGSASYGGTLVLSGSISPADNETASAPVKLEYSPDGVTWTEIATVSCVSSSYSYTWSPRLPRGSYQVRAVWGGSESYMSAASPAQTFDLKKGISQISLSLSEASAVYGAVQTTVTGSISPAEPETGSVKVTIEYSRDKANWRTISVPTTVSSRYTYTWSPSLDAGTYYVRSLWGGSENYEGATSEVKEFVVNKASTRITLAFSKESPQPGETVTLSGSIEPAIAGVEVTLTYTGPDGRTSTKTLRTTAEGRFTDSITVDKEGEWRVTATWGGSDNYRGSEQSAQLSVRAPFPLLYIVLAVVGGAVVVVVVVVIARRPKEELPPPPPPPPA